MEKLSIEEKAKHYDELLVKLQEAKEDNNVCDERYYCVIDDIVPELKESEDERIRKALLEYFNEQCDMSDWNGIYGYQVVAWLEKQGKLIEHYEDKLDRCACENFNKGYKAAIEHQKEKQDERPEHGYLKTTYYYGKKPRWAIGDTLAYYEIRTDEEGECVLGKVTKIEFDNQEENDWVYTFEDGSADCEQALLECATYKKN